MIEVSFTYDFRHDVDEKSYATMAKKVTSIMLSCPGFIEFRAYRNLLGSPQVRRISVWRSFADYAALLQPPEFQTLTNEFRSYVYNLTIHVWGTSPYVPEPIRKPA